MPRSVNELRYAGVRDVTDLTDGEIKTIAAFVMQNERNFNNPQYLEIGVLAGTTIRYCKQYTTKTHFTGIDLFESWMPDPTNTHISDTFNKSDVEMIVGDRATFLMGDSKNVLQDLIASGHENKYQFIFIDGNHSYEATKQDFELAKYLVAKNGFIAFHNASSHMGPDFEQYVTRDGGPWAVTQEIIVNGSFKLVADIDRLKVFKECYKS